MILRQLRYLTVIAEQGSVARAARALHVAQPALSRQMQQLERRVGFRLLERDRRGVQLTPAGRVLHDGAQTLLHSLTATVERAWRASQGQLGRTRLALSRVPLHDTRVGTALAMLRSDYPDIECVTVEAISYHHADLLLSGAIDLGIGLALPGDAKDPPGIQMTSLGLEPMNGALLPAGHPLARRAELRPADLMDELLVMLDPSVSSLLPPIFTALRALGLMGNLETHRHIETVWNLVAAGHGWTVASSTYLATPPPGTVGVRLRGFDVQMHVVARWRAGDRSQLTRNVLDVLRRATDGASRSRRGPPAASHLPWNSAVDAVRNIGMRELKALLAAFEEGSLSDAARRLQLTQSSVSRQIHALEQAFGVMLLEREANGVTATEAGNVVVEDTHTALARFDEALLRARQVDRGFHGVCHVGTVAAELSHNVLVSALRAISQRTPALGIEVEEVLSTQQPGLLRNGRIDIGLAMAFPGLVNDRSIATLRLVDDVFDCAILPASSPLAQQAWVRPDDLRDIPLVFSQRHIFPGFYDAVMRAFEEVGFTPLLEHTHSGPRPVWRMLAGGYGWGLGPRSSRHRPIPGVVAVPIEGFAVPCGLDLLWRRNESDPNVLAVLDAFRNSARVSVAV